MQNELRGPRLGRRYFGKDLTNIEDGASRNASVEGKKIAEFGG